MRSLHEGGGKDENALCYSKSYCALAVASDLLDSHPHHAAAHQLLSGLRSMCLKFNGESGVSWERRHLHLRSRERTGRIQSESSPFGHHRRGLAASHHLCASVATLTRTGVSRIHGASVGDGSGGAELGYCLCEIYCAC